MADIFISYAREDAEVARQLADGLGALGWSVFWDRRIPAGRRWAEVIGDKLEAAQCVVTLWSKAALASDWVQEEADIAKYRGVLVPARIEDVLPPLGFRSIQAADLIGWPAKDPHEGFDQLVADIRNVLGGSLPVPAAPPPPAPPKRQERSGGGGQRSNGYLLRTFLGLLLILFTCFLVLGLFTPENGTQSSPWPLSLLAIAGIWPGVYVVTDAALRSERSGRGAATVLWVAGGLFLIVGAGSPGDPSMPPWQVPLIEGALLFGAAGAISFARLRLLFGLPHSDTTAIAADSRVK